MPLLVPAGLCAALPLCSCLEVARGVVDEPLAGTICLCEIVPELPASPRGVAIALLAGAMAAMAAAATAAGARALLRVGRCGRGGMLPPGAGQISVQGRARSRPIRPLRAPFLVPSNPVLTFSADRPWAPEEQSSRYRR